MPDETGTETTRSDAPSTDESPIDDAADGTAAAVADEQDANKETAQEAQGSGDSGEQVAPPGVEGCRVSQGRQGHHRRATALVRPAHRILRRSGPLRADAGGPGGDRTGESQVGGRTQVPGSRETRSPSQASAPAFASCGAGRSRRGRGRPTAARDAPAVLTAGGGRQAARVRGRPSLQMRWPPPPEGMCVALCHLRRRRADERSRRQHFEGNTGDHKEA